jgi:lactate permease
LLNGAVFALWPVMWIVLNALLLYNIAVVSGRFDAFRAWIVKHLPGDRRVVLVVIGFCFGALLEGISGFGTPVAITSSLLILVGFPPLEALVFVLIFNTAPVAFGALGVPVTVLGAVTGLKAATLAAMIGRQLPVMAVILPFYVMALYGGARSVRALWPMLLVAGGSFGVCQFLASNFIDYTLTDVLSSLGSLVVTLAFLRLWRPAPDAEFAIAPAAMDAPGARVLAPWQGWLPWILVSAVVIAWTSLGVAAEGQRKIPWPGLHKAISITLYGAKPYEAIWTFQPLGTGTAILLAAILTAAIVGVRPAEFVMCVGRTVRQAWLAVVTVMLIVGLAYVMNYSGIAYTLGEAAACHGQGFRSALAVPRVGGGAAFGERYVRQRAVRQFTGGGGAAIALERRAVRGDEFVGWRDGQDDFAAEHRDWRFGDEFEGPGRCGIRTDVRAQRGSDADVGRAGGGAAVCRAGDHSLAGC